MTSPTQSRRRWGGPVYGAGFHGKLPSRGDFVTFGLTGEFLLFWDEWISAGLANARAAVGIGWETLLDASPPWRFVLPGGLTSDGPITGVMVPSYDSVARRFPFMIACELPPAISPAAIPAACRAWYDSAEWAARRLVAMKAEPAFSRKVANALGMPLTPTTAERGESETLITSLIGAVSKESGLWWSRGGGVVAATLATATGLPDERQFIALLDGDWSAHGWREIPSNDPSPQDGLADSISDGQSEPLFTAVVGSASVPRPDQIGQPDYSPN